MQMHKGTNTPGTRCATLPVKPEAAREALAAGLIAASNQAAQYLG